MLFLFILLSTLGNDLETPAAEPDIRNVHNMQYAIQNKLGNGKKKKFQRREKQKQSIYSCAEGPTKKLNKGIMTS